MAVCPCGCPGQLDASRSVRGQRQLKANFPVLEGVTFNAPAYYLECGRGITPQEPLWLS